MPKTILAALLFAALPSTVQAQAHRFDIMSIEVPAPWRRESGDGFVNLYLQDKTRTCKVTVYLSGTSEGSPEADFGRWWQAYMVDFYKARNATEPRSERRGAWTAMSAAGDVRIDGRPFGARLTTMTGRGRVVPLLMLLSDQGCGAELDRVVAGIRLEGMDAVPSAPPSQPGPPSTAVTPAPETRGTGSDALVGEWMKSEQVVMGSFDTVRPKYRFEIIFRADGTYEARDYYTPIPAIERGSYTVAGSVIRFRPAERRNSSRPLQPYERQYTIGQHPTRTGEASHGLQLLEENTGWNTYRRVGNAPATQSAPAVGPLAPSGDLARLHGGWKRSISRVPDFTSAASMATYQGYANFTYELRPDGSYRYTQETWFGHTRNEYLTVEETGAWRAQGDVLEMIPASNAWVLRSQKKDGPVKERGANPLEWTSYRWGFHFWEGTQEWNLYLRSSQPTKRDGSWAGTGPFADAYYFKAR